MAIFFDLLTAGTGLVMVQADGQQIDRATLGRLAAQAGDQLEDLRGRRVGLQLPAIGSALAWLAALERLATNVFLLPHGMRPEDLAAQWQLQAWLSPSRGEVERLEAWRDDNVPCAEGVTILTSGTTGAPKAVRHTWRSLVQPVRTRPDAPRGGRWLLAYQPHLYAGVQVIVQCLSQLGTLVVADQQMSPESIVERMVEWGVAWASATPSFWRRLVLLAGQDRLRRVPLRQITLGGEAADQLLLDQLRHLFPAARLTHIYATTELGRCFAVSDGRAGFPLGWLDAPPPGVALKVVDSQLHVRRSAASAPHAPAESAESAASGWTRPPGDGDDLGAWRPTGDLVRIEGDRVLFVGRDSDMINVGGHKVSPLQVEEVVRGVSGVADARVFAHSSSIAGQLVACQIVPQAGTDARQLRQLVLDACRRRLHRAEIPRIVELVDRIDISPSGKRLRQA